MSDTVFQSCTPSEMTRDAFVTRFADIYEHSARIAEQAYDQRMARILLDTDRQAQLDLINAHPDLAGKAAVAGELTEASTAEQAGAGISECPPGRIFPLYCTE